MSRHSPAKHCCAERSPDSEQRAVKYLLADVAGTAPCARCCARGPVRHKVSQSGTISEDFAIVDGSPKEATSSKLCFVQSLSIQGQHCEKYLLLNRRRLSAGRGSLAVIPVVESFTRLSEGLSAYVGCQLRSLPSRSREYRLAHSAVHTALPVISV
jgi:hypothetical protein